MTSLIYPNQVYQHSAHPQLSCTQAPCARPRSTVHRRASASASGKTSLPVWNLSARPSLDVLPSCSPHHPSSRTANLRAQTAGRRYSKMMASVLRAPFSSSSCAGGAARAERRTQNAESAGWTPHRDIRPYPRRTGTRAAAEERHSPTRGAESRIGRASPPTSPAMTATRTSERTVSLIALRPGPAAPRGPGGEGRGGKGMTRIYGGAYTYAYRCR